MNDRDADAEALVSCESNKCSTILLPRLHLKIMILHRIKEHRFLCGYVTSVSFAVLTVGCALVSKQTRPFRVSRMPRARSFSH